MTPHATPDATKAYADNCWKQNPQLSPNSWRLWEGLMASKLYQTDPTDFAKWFGAGCNVWQVKHHQQPLVTALSSSLKAQKVSRDQIILHGAGGFTNTPTDTTVQVGEGIFHTLDGGVMTAQLKQLCEWLGVERLESFVVMQPELHRQQADFEAQLISVFAALEQACIDGLIGCYGIESAALALPAEHDYALDLSWVWQCAQKAAEQAWGRRKRPRLRLLQIPMNLLQLNPLKEVNTQAASFGGKTVSVTCLELAARLHLAVLVESSLKAGPVHFLQPQTVPQQLAQELMGRIDVSWHDTTLPAIAVNAMASIPNVIGTQATGATLADLATIQRLGDFADPGAVLGVPTDNLAEAA